MPVPILIFGIGNESRGDDALGVLLLRRLQQQWGDCPDIEWMEAYQLQIEHALDLAGRKCVIFLDAGHETPAPYQFYRVPAAEDTTPFSHALTPQALLAVCRRVAGEPPPAWLMCVRGESFELGEGLSALAAERLQKAFEHASHFVAQAAAPASLLHLAELPPPPSQAPTRGEGLGGQARPPALQETSME